MEERQTYYGVFYFATKKVSEVMIGEKLLEIIHSNPIIEKLSDFLDEARKIWSQSHSNKEFVKITEYKTKENNHIIYIDKSVKF
jgi:chaperonin GroEL (HSP60 family)